MAYSDFTLQSVVEQFGLTTMTVGGFFDSVPPAPAISPILATLLPELLPLAAKINTEKARSEFLVANILIEIWRQFSGTISLFSGIEFAVDRASGLSGFCDYLISLSSEQLVVRAPVVAVMEAKKGDLLTGWGQCLAEMVAVQRFNVSHENEIPKIYGAVTTGTAWMFGFLEGKTATIDYKEYTIDEPERICGILIAMVRQQV